MKGFHMRGYSIAEVLGGFAKWSAIIVVFGFSITLSYMFFLSITPPDKSWFTYTGLGLTEGGFVLWMAVFMLTRHDPVHKAIALVMACACAFTSLAVAGYEFYVLLSSEFALAHNALVIQAISILLEIMFGAHITAFIIDMFASYFARPGHAFRASGRAVMVSNAFEQTGSATVVEADQKLALPEGTSEAEAEASGDTELALPNVVQKVINAASAKVAPVRVEDRLLVLELLAKEHPEMSAKEIAAQTGLSPRSVRRWQKEGR
jgi:hypothetical protein